MVTSSSLLISQCLKRNKLSFFSKNNDFCFHLSLENCITSHFFIYLFLYRSYYNTIQYLLVFYTISHC